MKRLAPKRRRFYSERSRISS